MQNLAELPKDLPAPVDDGACNHLFGVKLPNVLLPSHRARLVSLAQIPGWAVIYCYPMTGRPDQALPSGWNEIPGARGCTPQSCSFRDHSGELARLNAKVFGVSTQSSTYQAEVAERLHLPFELLSDAEGKFWRGLNLPMLQVAEQTLIKRVTLIVHGGIVKKYFYPVFPPDKNAEEVVAWLLENGHNNSLQARRP